MTESASGPSDIAIYLKLHAIYQNDPKLGVEKVHKQLLADNPSWAGKVSLKRVKTLRNQNGLTSLASGAPGAAGNTSADPISLIQVPPGGILETSKYPRVEKPPEALLALEARFKQRLAQGSKALHAQNNMHNEAKLAGEKYGGGWYAVLPDGQEEYVWGKLLWVPCAIGAGEEAHSRYTFLERGRKEAVLGNPAGVYMVYMGLRTAIAELEIVKRGKVKVSDARLARQLEAEYGMDPIPFGQEVDRDPESACGVLLTNVLWDLATG